MKAIVWKRGTANESRREYVKANASETAKTNIRGNIGKKKRNCLREPSVAWLAALTLTLTVLLCGCANQSEESANAQFNAAAEQENLSNGENAAAEQENTTIRIGALKGPTSMGLLFLMQDKEMEKSALQYDFQMATGADELLPLMVKGDLDVALVPANVASVLYAKSQGAVCVVDVNTLGVLYLVSGETYTDLQDLKGKTIYLTGKGTTPDYVLQYVLAENGFAAGDCKLEYKSEATEVAALLAENPSAVGLLPQPFVTAACMQNTALQVVFDMNAEWEKLQSKGMVTGVTLVRKAFLEEEPEAVKAFLEDHERSVKAINENPAQGATYAVEAGIVAKEPIAKKAIPACNITCITGAEMQEAVSSYLEVLYHFDAAAVGGALPGEDFYFD